ncbi:alpha/beta fold hydrolase [Streptomyces sp. NPDC059255]|uniref:alpha/beta fold hydrolase n=1 Tax=Streptomyces sp. NPDC059255 TaxID=3346793 RepID=UPI0036AFA943
MRWRTRPGGWRIRRAAAPPSCRPSGRTSGPGCARTAWLTAWLDALLDGLGLARTHLCGHSYGAWLAARYALHAPQRVDRLALVDPTQVFAGFRPGYLLRALPTLIRPSEARARAFVAWETAGTHPDETWLRYERHCWSDGEIRRSQGLRPTVVQTRVRVDRTGEDTLTPGRHACELALFLPSGCYATNAVAQWVAWAGSYGGGPA